MGVAIGTDARHLPEGLQRGAEIGHEICRWGVDCILVVPVPEHMNLQKRRLSLNLLAFSCIVHAAVDARRQSRSAALPSHLSAVVWHHAACKVSNDGFSGPEEVFPEHFYAGVDCSSVLPVLLR